MLVNHIRIGVVILIVSQIHNIPSLSIYQLVTDVFHVVAFPITEASFEQ